MCIFSAPKMPPIPTPATFQPMQTPKDLTNGKSAADQLRAKRGLFASIFSPLAAQTTPMTTGTTGGATGA